MNPSQRTAWYAGVLALTLTAAALLVWLLFRTLFESTFFALLLAAVSLSSWYYGRTGRRIRYRVVGGRADAFSAGLYSVVRDLYRLSELVSFAAIALVMAWVTSAWRESRTLLAQTLASIGEAVVATDREGRVTFLNPPAEALLGWQEREARGKPAGSVMRLIDEKSREPVENPLVSALRNRVTVTTAEPALLLSRSGAEIPLEHSAAPVRDRSGAVRGGILVFRDVSARRNLEAQLMHAQKMDAVGRVAGGVAGDFNNLLTVITGYSEMLRTELPQGHRLRAPVDEIIRAAERAAGLTRHLLAFSGAGTQSRALDLNSLIHAMEPTLRRLIGERIELILLTSPGLGRVTADPAVIEQAIVNLAANSRDAMPEGGKLVIETANMQFDMAAAGRSAGITPGSYVMMAVSDTGIGMDAETRSRAFEPFFTTKPAGKGTGLGLATVYGAVKQSGGQVTLYSQPGCGTIFEVYLPRVRETAPAVHPGSRKGSETVLLVDNEDGVRRVVSAILKSNGYDVLEAADAGLALSAYEKNAHKIDLVVTDIVMPRRNGIDLGRELSSRAATLKILYMSGYRDNPADIGLDEMPRAFLQKPFTPDALLAKVREILDA